MISFLEIDEKIRSGDVSGAQRAIDDFNLAKIKRVDYVTFASLARRVGRPHLSIRLLHGIVRDEKNPYGPSTLSEKVEYSMGLIKIGAVKEGRTLLKEVPLMSDAQAHLFLALSYFNDWNYENAIDLLKQYLSSFEISEYQRLIANVNLCAGLIGMGRLAEADEIIIANLLIAESSQYHLAKANLLELKAQVNIRNKKYSEANVTLNSAFDLIGHNWFADALFLKKWKSILELSQRPQDQSSVQLVLDAQKDAREMGHWETVRDLDFHLSTICHDLGLYNHLFHGTPYEAYRLRLRENFLNDPPPSEHYFWKLGPSLPGHNVRELDLNSTQSYSRLLHQMMINLTSDFYRPIQVASLAAGLFKNEFYNPITTVNRIHQLVTRLRIWLNENVPGLTLESNRGAYVLEASHPVVIKTIGKQAEEEICSEGYSLQNILAAIAPTGDLNVSKDYSVREISKLTKHSHSTTLRALKFGISKGAVSRVGQGKNIRYKIIKKVA